MEPVVIRVEGAEAAEVEDVQEAEHEAQAEETEAWRDALSNVTSELAGLNQRVLAAMETNGTQSAELRQLVQTQQELIRSLMESNSQRDAQLLETVRTLLTPPPVVEVVPETPNETPPAVVEPEAVAVSEPEVRVRRFRAI